MPIWNWQQEDWPQFRYDTAKLSGLEAEFLRNSGIFIGAIKHVTDDDRHQLIVELISDEALNTSEIEGEILNRDSLQSSIRRNFGLTTDNRKIPAAEQGIAQMMVELYRQFDTPLSNELLFHWHEMLMNGRRDIKDVGGYRTHDSAMQVVSGPLHEPKIHFEAPPSKSIPAEMKRFIEWFDRTGPGGKSPLPILTRAGIAHLYFVCIHPFEDGNGRIGRAVAEKAISEGLGHSTLVALSQTINRARKVYYAMLEGSNKHNEITDWLVYFAQAVLDAQAQAQRMVEFIIAKTKYFDRLRGQLNDRQQKAILRMMQEGPDGFKGGLNAEKYISLTGTSRATATRDLQDLVEKDALIQVGSLKSTRYHLPITFKL
ncbi:Fic family protein [Phragmitibacter flavus]|uniref:Fic family protein n=1 Tax=Phragmitibacter flavus TaxID=2576071 RepID=A0A5R8KIV7_9BACT|nr:Fic family protein [Phragmitibacter flavus]